MPRERPLIAFFDYPDVFEDFYPHYGVKQKDFITRWAATGNHAFLAVLQREIGDVVWYAFSLAPEEDGGRHETVGCRVRMLPSSWAHRALWRLFYLPRAAWRWRRAYPLYATLASYVALFSLPFVKALLRDRPDYIFVQDYASGRFDVLLLAARLLGVPLIAYHSGSRPERYVGRAAKRWSIPRADWLVVSSRDELEMLARRYRVSRRRLRVILTPIDTEAFRPLDRPAACRAAGLDAARRYILFVGRFDDRVKRVGALIRAFGALSAQHPDVELLLVGDGPDAPRLRQLAESSAPGRVRFLGWVSGAAALAPLYNSAECLVLPSLHEGFPTVVGEAMACGTPVLASRVGGVGEMVQPGQTGWLLTPGDDAQLQDGLGHVMSHPEVAAAMRPGVRSMAEQRVSPSAVSAALRLCFSR
jgi:glycosyltransferase involved in cell wall biosynthesis